MTISHGREGNSVKASSCGSVNPVRQHTKITNSVTSVNRSMLTLEIMLTLMDKNGFNASNVTNGFTAAVKSKMVTIIS